MDSLINCAAYDGAVVLNINSNNKLEIVQFGVIINPKKNVNKEYQKLLKTTNSGSRHEKAARYACENKDDYIIVVSENKTISILHGTKPIYWRNKKYKKY